MNPKDMFMVLTKCANPIKWMLAYRHLNMDDTMFCHVLQGSFVMVILTAPSNKDELTAWHLSIVFVKLALIVLLALFKVLLYFLYFICSVPHKQNKSITQINRQNYNEDTN